jgi:hypothetical protein
MPYSGRLMEAGKVTTWFFWRARVETLIDARKNHRCTSGKGSWMTRIMTTRYALWSGKHLCPSPPHQLCPPAHPQDLMR